jgi:rod shape-determining protein MreD
MLICAYALAHTALLLQGILLPRLAILAFAPYLALVMMRCETSKALWLSTLAGIMIDLLSDDPIGIHALNYVIVTALLIRAKMHFSHEQPLHLSVYTALISSLSTVLQLVLLFLFDRRVPFEGRWFFTELIGMPVMDALYSFIWFTAPLSLFEKLKKMWSLFWLKRKNLSRTSH